MIQETLKKLGLKDKEVAIYLAIMKLGRTTPAHLAKVTNINRATVYSVVALLVQKGLVTEDMGNKIRYINALPPKDLHGLIQKEKRQLSIKEKLVEQAVREFSDLPLNTNYAVPHIRLIDDKNLEQQLRDSVEKWEASLKKTDPTMTWWGFQDHTFAEQFESWINWYWERAPEEMNLKLLSNTSEIEKRLDTKNLTRRIIKPVVQEADFTATTWVIGEYLLMIYTNEKPFYAIEIHNPILAHNHRELFKNIWDKL